MPSAFTSPVDIANRCLQHMGAERIVAFTDPSKNAAETSFVYDRLRQEELRNNVWRFAIHRCVLRPLASTTKLWTPPVYASGTTYTTGQIVSYNNGYVTENYQSLVSSNTGNQPDTSPTQWELYTGVLYAPVYDATATYLPGEIVVDTAAYVCLVQSKGASPSGTPASFAALNGTLTAVTILYPIGSGPVEQTFTRNVYPLPSGFLREATQDPRTGVDTNKPLYGDWLMENQFIVTRETQAVIFRYVGDAAAVARMDVMFCEALAARMAFELGETFTQSPEKIKTFSNTYQKVISDAESVNAIETDGQPMAGDYSIPEDIANRALQYLGRQRIASFADMTREASEMQFVYDKLRKAELRRNIWRFSIKRCILRPLTTTMKKVVPAAYVAGTSYAIGAIVSYNDGYANRYWQNTVAANVGNLPIFKDSGWVLYAGVIYADYYDATGGTTYYTGDMVYVPGAATAWSSLTTYNAGDLVSYSGVNYVSLLGTNLNQTPNTATTYWAVYYGPAGSNTVYATLQSTSSNPTTAPVDSGGNVEWVAITGATLQAAPVFSTMVAGSVNENEAENIYMLPYGFLRRAPDAPKDGQISLWGAPTNRMPDDFDFEANYFVSNFIDPPIALRFVADVTDVRDMDAMFCEGLALRMALSTVDALAPPPSPGPNGQMMPPATGSLRRDLAQMYIRFMGEARAVNAIEVGYEEPPMDDYISTRL